MDLQWHPKMTLKMLNWNHIGWEQNVQVVNKLRKWCHCCVTSCFKFYMMNHIAHAHMITIKTIAHLFNHERSCFCTVSKCPVGVSSDTHSVLQEIASVYVFSVVICCCFVLCQWTLRLWSSLWPWCWECCCWRSLCAAAAAAVNADAQGDGLHLTHTR